MRLRHIVSATGDLNVDSTNVLDSLYNLGLDIQVGHGMVKAVFMSVTAHDMHTRATYLAMKRHISGP